MVFLLTMEIWSKNQVNQWLNTPFQNHIITRNQINRQILFVKRALREQTKLLKKHQIWMTILYYVAFLYILSNKMKSKNKRQGKGFRFGKRVVGAGETANRVTIVFLQRKPVVDSETSDGSKRLVCGTDMWMCHTVAAVCMVKFCCFVFRRNVMDPEWK